MANRRDAHASPHADHALAGDHADPPVAFQVRFPGGARRLLDLLSDKDVEYAGIERRSAEDAATEKDTPVQATLGRCQMKVLSLAIIVSLGILLQGCIRAVYIPPATSETPTAQLIHVSRINLAVQDLYFVKINGVTVMEPGARLLGPTAFRPFDFYILPGEYSVDYQILRVIRPGNVTWIFGSIGRAAPTDSDVTNTNGTTTMVVSPTQAGKTMSDFDLLYPTGVLGH